MTIEALPVNRHVVLKPFTYNGVSLLRGEVVDTTTWRQAGQLVDQRRLLPVAGDTDVFTSRTGRLFINEDHMIAGDPEPESEPETEEEAPAEKTEPEVEQPVEAVKAARKTARINATKARNAKKKVASARVSTGKKVDTNA